MYVNVLFKLKSLQVFGKNHNLVISISIINCFLLLCAK
jgi:hypothetical protein